MSEVYQSTLYNICATGAVDSNEGLFFDQGISNILPCKVEASWDRGDKRQVYVVDSQMWERFFLESSLISRAWVVQERLLAPRVIHFGRHQLGWECH
jgi:hypothetical protein